MVSQTSTARWTISAIPLLVANRFTRLIAASAFEAVTTYALGLSKTHLPDPGCGPKLMRTAGFWSDGVTVRNDLVMTANCGRQSLLHDMRLA